MANSLFTLRGRMDKWPISRCSIRLASIRYSSTWCLSPGAVCRVSLLFGIYTKSAGFTCIRMQASNPVMLYIGRACTKTGTSCVQSVIRPISRSSTIRTPKPIKRLKRLGARSTLVAKRVTGPAVGMSSGHSVRRPIQGFKTGSRTHQKQRGRTGNQTHQ